jgi:hypothetical protein
MEVLYTPETWYLLGDAVTAEAVYSAARQRLLDVHNKQVQRALAFEGVESLSVEQEEDYAERLVMLTGMLEHYFTWAVEHDHFTPVKVEIEFEVPITTLDGEDYVIDGRPVMYQGRLDGLAQDPQGRYWILEHKTTGQMGAIEYLEVDSQVSSYAWAIQTQLGIQVAGILYTQALKAFPSPPKKLKKQREGRWFSVNRQQRTTRNLFLATLERHGEDPRLYSEFLGYLDTKGNPFFRRIPIFRNEASLEYVGRNIYLESVEMLNDPVIYPSPAFFNCNRCRFREPCIAKQNGYDYQFILDELFVRRDKEVAAPITLGVSKEMLP